jgi:hypothetical protein
LTLEPNRRYSSLLYPHSFDFSFDRLPHTTFNVMARKNQIERAIKEIQARRPAPDIDFTQHQLENGFTVSTQERVVKEVISSSFPLTHAYSLTDGKPIVHGGNVSAGASPGYEHTHRRAILFQNRKGQAGHRLP